MKPESVYCERQEDGSGDKSKGSQPHGEDTLSEIAGQAAKIPPHVSRRL